MADRDGDAVTDPGKAVFLSYASQDAEAAQQLCNALRAAGIEVWFDRSELRGGDAWDRQIHEQIRDCRLFVAIISAHTEARDEGYFRREWRLAVDRTHDMAEHKAFLVPVAIDDTPELDAAVPEKFRQVQWTRLPVGNTPLAFVERIGQMLTPGESRALASSRPASGPPSTPSVLPSAVAASAAPENSIAVLPFVNLGGEADDEYFSDGLAEEILNALGQVEALRVAARSSAFSFRGKATDIPAIAGKLQVANVLEGSVRRAGQRIRVTIQLVDARTGFQVWSERYDRQMEDIFELQDDIARAITERLKVSLGAGLRRSTSDLEAYELYLKGRYYWAQRPQGIGKAIEYFERAIEQDPNYARARAGLADCYVTLGSWENGTMAPIEAMAKAKEAAGKALELDERLAEAHTTLAYRTTHHDWDWACAEAQFQHAFELNPNYVVCHHWYSHYLTAVGRTEESLKASKRCLELDPLDLVMNIHMAWHYHFARQYEQAIEQCWKTGELHPNSFWLAYFFGLAYEQQGHVDRAVEEFRTSVTMSGNVTFATAALGHLYGIAGKADEACAVYEELKARAERAYVPAYDIALVCTGMGWNDQALEYLARAQQERSGWMTYLKVDPRLDPLRRDARFIDLLRRVRLAP
jgi:TolB-like protein/Tfp pilus assembly protein PilF